MADTKISELTEAAAATSTITQTVLVDGANKKVTHTAPGGMLSKIYQRTTTLTDAQIKALPTTPIDVVPAPGAGKQVVVLGAVCNVDPSAGVYASVDVGAFMFLEINGNLNGYAVSGVFSEVNAAFTTADPFCVQFPTVAGPIVTDKLSAIRIGDFTDMENFAVRLFMSNGQDFTGGNAANTLSITVFYSIIDV